MSEEEVCKICGHSWDLHDSYCSFPTPGKGFHGVCFCCGEEGCCGKKSEDNEEDFNAVCDELENYDLTSKEREYAEELKEKFLTKEMKSPYHALEQRLSGLPHDATEARIRRKYSVESASNEELDEHQEGLTAPSIFHIPMPMLQQDLEVCLSCNAPFYSVLHSEKCEKPSTGKPHYARIQELKMLWAEWVDGGFINAIDELGYVLFDSEEDKGLALEAYDKMKEQENDL